MGLEILCSNEFVLDKELIAKLNLAFEVLSDDEDLSDKTINIKIVNNEEMINLNKQQMGSKI